MKLQSFKTNALMKHDAIITKEGRTEKPSPQEAGAITNQLKAIARPRPYTLPQIIGKLTKGHTAILSDVYLDLKNDSERIKQQEYELTKDGNNKNFWRVLRLKKFFFKSTQLVLLDIDDDYGIVPIEEAISSYDGEASAFYGTFSFGKDNGEGGKKNGYRIVFQLDRPITDRKEYQEVAKVLRRDFVRRFPNFKEENIDVMSGTSLWHGGKTEAHYLQPQNVLRLQPLLYEARKVLAEIEKEKVERRNNRAKAFGNSLNRPSIPFSELEKMAKAIGHIQSGGTYHLWSTLALSIRSHELAGEITFEEGYALYDIISGGESSMDEYEDMFNPNGEMTIGTFIAHAKEKGYKMSSMANRFKDKSKERIPVERVSARLLNGKKYLHYEDTLRIIKEEGRVLVDSPTGTGKTYSVMKAFKELEKEQDTFLIFSAHTTLLSSQVAHEHDAILIAGDSKLKVKEIESHVASGKRRFVVVYDKVKELFEILKYELNRFAKKVYLVVDEVHTLTNAYGYRFHAIDSLIATSEQVDSFVGLTGTTDAVLTDAYDKKVLVTGANRFSPSNQNLLMTYEKMEERNAMLVTSIERLVKKDNLQVLCFINNKDDIERTRKMLERRNLKVSYVTSDTKNSETYTNIVETASMGNADVLLSTSVMADGVSILNDYKSACIVVTDQSSPIYDPSTVKQMSNRFRNDYELFTLYIQQEKDEMEGLKSYVADEEDTINMDLIYDELNERSTRFVEYLNQEFNGELIESFMPSVIEGEYAIYTKRDKIDEALPFRLDNEKLSIINNRFTLRFKALELLEKMHTGHRYSFAKRVFQLVANTKNELVINHANQETFDKEFAMKFIEEEKKEKQEVQEMKRESRERFGELFTEEVYDVFKVGYEKGMNEAVDDFVFEANDDQINAMKKVVNVLNYEQTKKVVGRVMKRAQINEFTKEIVQLLEVGYFDIVTRETISKKIYNQILMNKNCELTPNEIEERIYEPLRNELGVVDSDIKKIEKMFTVTSVRRRIEGERVTLKMFTEFTISDFAEKYDMTFDEVKDIMLKVIKNQSKTKRSNYMKVYFELYA